MHCHLWSWQSQMQGWPKQGEMLVYQRGDPYFCNGDQKSVYVSVECAVLRRSHRWKHFVWRALPKEYNEADLQGYLIGGSSNYKWQMCKMWVLHYSEAIVFRMLRQDWGKLIQSKAQHPPASNGLRKRSTAWWVEAIYSTQHQHLFGVQLKKLTTLLHEFQMILYY